MRFVGIVDDRLAVRMSSAADNADNFVLSACADVGCGQLDSCC